MTETKDQLPKEEWPWWWSRDEERYFGPCASKRDAVMEAFADDDSVTYVHVMQAVHGEVFTDLLDGDRLSELFDDSNEEHADPDGDCLSASIKSEEWEKLAKRLNRMIKSFVRGHGVKAFMFETSTNGETVDLSRPVISSLPEQAQEAISQLAGAWSPDGGAAGYFAEQAFKDLQAALAPKPETAT